MQRTIGRFHVLTDYHFQQRYSHAEIARLAIEGGADTIQFREKHSGIRHVLKEAAETAEVCRRQSAVFVVDDRIDVAQAVSADGVHLGQSDFPIPAARRVLGPEALIGGTATTLEQALRIEDDGADYVGFGPVFKTASKRNPASVKGLATLTRVCEAVGVPVIAIAGVTAERVESVMNAGAHGIAVMTAITLAANPVRAAADIRAALDAASGADTVVGRTDGLT
ncbi:MAG: thiamine phosphate synthase [Rhodothermales bacterium]